jgi:hypothetical protein
MPNAKPVHEIRLARIKASIWARVKTDEGGNTAVWFSVTVVRLFRKEDRWHEATCFGRDDLPLVAKVADLAHTWIFEHRQQQQIGKTAKQNETVNEDA